jgi:ankyrin repeat protein
MRTDGVDAGTEGGYQATVRLLLKLGAAVEVTDEDGWTSLMRAAEKRHEAVVELLLKIDGVDPDSKDLEMSRTPLSWAAEKGHEAVVKLLLKREGVNPDSRDSWGQTPLSWAAENGHEAVMKLLLARNGVGPDSEECN